MLGKHHRRSRLTEFDANVLCLLFFRRNRVIYRKWNVRIVFDKIKHTSSLNGEIPPFLWIKIRSKTKWNSSVKKEISSNNNVMWILRYVQNIQFHLPLVSWLYRIKLANYTGKWENTKTKYQSFLSFEMNLALLNILSKKSEDFLIKTIWLK